NLRSNNYICHLSVFSRELLDKVGKFRSEYDGSQDHDMILRLTEQAQKIVHIPKLLYYWRAHSNSVAQNIDIKDYAIKAAQAAIVASLERRGITGVTVDSIKAYKSMYRLHYPIIKNDLVSIIIPTKNHSDDLKKCIKSIFEKSTYPNFEIVIVDNGSDEEALFEYYEEIKQYPNVTVCSLDIPFNYSRINNYAISKAKGEYYLLLNNDIEIITPNWIEEMLMYVQREDVGAAGAMLYYPDDTVQHAGVLLGLNGIAGHYFKNFGRNEIGYMGRLSYAQDMTAVTAACMLIKASVFHQIGGLDEGFEVAFNDVDLCMKIRKAGYLIVWTPFAELYHYESKSRGYEDTEEKQRRFMREIDRFQARWGKELRAGDPYYNPNLSLERDDFYPKNLK
ncbi:MAG: glycosyltransferase, partial [Clostridia bacterium]|nr:glycosyltransferase [Clostridia bacterium]